MAPLKMGADLFEIGFWFTIVLILGFIFWCVKRSAQLEALGEEIDGAGICVVPPVAAVPATTALEVESEPPPMAQASEEVLAPRCSASSGVGMEQREADPEADRRSKGERLCCQTLEQIYGKPFRSCRPDFLRNPKTGRNLEIDCYNSEVKIGIEYQGRQHYAFPNSYHKTESEFWDQVERDQLKSKLCNQEGVHLLIVPYHIPLGKVADFIKENLLISRICPASSGQE